MSGLLLGILLMGAGAQAPGEDLFAKGQYAEAIVAFEGLPLEEQTAPVLNRLGISYHLLNRLKEAEAAYRRAIKADSEMAAARNNLGALRYTQRKFGDADGEFRRAADHDADHSILTSNLHWARYARDNQRAASNRADQVAAERPLLIEPFEGADMLAIVPLVPPDAKETAWRHQVRGDTYTARKMYDDAVIEYKKSIAVDRYNASVANRLGIAYHHLRKFREAEQQYREALRLRPNYLDPLINLGVVDYVRKDYEGALNRYTRALELQPTSVTLLRNLGACLFSMERWDEGMRVYERALELNPNLFDQTSGAGPAIQMSLKGTSMLNLHFAKLFASRGEVDLAISYLYKAIENGLADATLLTDDEAFRSLVADERFTRMVELIAAGRSRI